MEQRQKKIRKRGEPEIESKFLLPQPHTQPPVYEEIKSQSKGSRVWQEGHLSEQIQWHENSVLTFQHEFTWQKYYAY